MKNNYLKFSIVFTLFLLLTSSVYAQSIAISGYVFNEYNEPLNGVNVNLSLAGKSTTSDATGFYSFNISSVVDFLYKNIPASSFNGLELSIHANAEDVKIDMFDISGRYIAHIISGKNLKGDYILYPSAYIPADQYSIALIRAIVGNQLSYFKCAGMTNFNLPKGFIESVTPSKKSAASFSPEALDTLVFTHNSYYTHKVGISCYTCSPGNVNLVNNSPLANPSLSGTAVSISQINLNWTDNSVNELGFEIERAPGGTTSYSQIHTTNPQVTTYSNTGLSASTSYKYRVRAYNSVGKSPYSNEISVATTALEYNFPGGTLDDLKAVSPDLSFGTLTISGTLEIPHNENTVTLNLDNLNVNAAINVTYPICYPFYNAPNLVVNASGTVTLNSSITLTGKYGESESSTTTCHDCNGKDGGDVIINAANIYANKNIYTYGGFGSTYYVTSSLKNGCDGGDGGDIKLLASNILNIGSDCTMKLQGEDGGPGIGGGVDGTDGVDGHVYFSGTTISMYEHTSDINMFSYNAQIIDYVKMNIYGHVSYGEEFTHRDSYGSTYISYDNGAFIDWIEDLYLLDLKLTSAVKVSLTASNDFADLDLFILRLSDLSLMGYSNGATSNESITTIYIAPGKYLIGVSYADDGQSTDTEYTLKIKQ